MRSGRRAKRQLSLFPDARLATGRISGNGLDKRTEAEQREEARPGKGESQASADTTAITQITTKKLWLCLYFPSLALVALTPESGFPQLAQPAVVIETQGSQSVVIAATPAALAAGIFIGMALNAALALCPGLKVGERNRVAEQQSLNRLAQWALSFTPVVSCIDQGLLLEVRGSLRLFGGLSALLRNIRDDLSASGCEAYIAYAPMPRAALWLARDLQSPGSVPGCATLTHLRSVLAPLPLTCLGWPEKVQQKLLRMGLRNLGDCLRLSRDGFARRIGHSYLAQLDQATGRAPDLPVAYQPPVRFRARLDLSLETIETGPILQLCQALLAQLGAFMRQRQQGVGMLRFDLLHYQRAATPVVIAARDLQQQADYFFELLCLRLEHLVLESPVTAVRLCASLQEWQGPEDGVLTLFAAPNLNDLEFDYLLEKLRARLGRAQVVFVYSVADHRPEHAWGMAPDPAADRSAETVPGELLSRPRPLWLLEEPRRLGQSQGLPQWYGPVSFVSGAERIEAGWWDGADIQRDYYIVVRRNGARGWVYRDCRHAHNSHKNRESAWFLHGVFA
jgi:protein ImuB